MTDFASAAMLRVLAQGMRDLGLNPGDTNTDHDDARIQLRQKQDLVRSAVVQGGLACLPLLGRGMHRLTHEPTHHALVSARNAQDLFERWQRLERYIHSRHRCVIETSATSSACIRHVSVLRDSAPSAAEDLVVAGVLTALLEAIGLQRVDLRLGHNGAYSVSNLQDVNSAVARGVTAIWHFTWRGVAAPHKIPSANTALSELGADGAWPDTVRLAYSALAADLSKPMDLPALSKALGIPSRSLQRRLREGGLSYSRLLAEARCRTAAWRLLKTTAPIAEIGFMSGFSDQAHFTREMQKRVGMPPAAYRAAFSCAIQRRSALQNRRPG